jgi:hypothetical protein
MFLVGLRKTKKNYVRIVVCGPRGEPSTSEHESGRSAMPSRSVRREMHTKVWYKNVKKDYFEDLGVYGKIMLKGIFRNGVQWIQLAQDRVQWRVL